MKTCPNCGKIIGDTAINCFFCHYNYNLRRVLTQDEIVAKREIEEQEKKEFVTKRERAEQERERAKQEIDKNRKLLNPLYEYETVIIRDLPNGSIDNITLKNTLDKYSRAGWKLHSVVSNELGKNVSGVSIGVVSTSSNATIDELVLIFERMYKK